MSSARFTMDGRHRLVLVRGGLDDADDGGDDWKDFCSNIGWQPMDSEPTDDFEARLAARIVTRAKGNVVPIDAVRTDAMGESMAGVSDADFSVGVRADDIRRLEGDSHGTRWSHRLGAVVAALAVAAVALLVVATMVSSRRHPAAASLPEPSSGPTWRANVARPDHQESNDDSAPTDSSPPEIGPVRASPNDSATPNPSHESKSPGLLVAQNQTKPRARASGLIGARAPRADVAKSESAPPETFIDWASRPRLLADLDGSRTPYSRASTGWGVVGRERVSLSTAGVTFATAGAHVSSAVWPNGRFTLDGPVSRSAVASSTPSTGAWALSSASNRWMGMSVTPTLQPNTSPASVGVMAQLDLGKALAL